MKLSIIIPTLNEAKGIKLCLDKLADLRNKGHEVIVVDGRSQDATRGIAEALCDQFINSDASRSLQMNIGAKHASGDFFLFLHADTLLPEDLSELMRVCIPGVPVWGRFDVRLSGSGILFRMIERCMAIRSRLTGIATGDQAMFIERGLFEKIGAYPELALMEDIAISKRLNKFSRPICLKQNVCTSSRRWEENGVIKTIVKMWVLRFLYFFNCNTDMLAKLYR